MVGVWAGQPLRLGRIAHGACRFVAVVEEAILIVEDLMYLDAAVDQVSARLFNVVNEQSGDSVGAARSHDALSMVSDQEGNHEEALVHAQESLRRHRQLGHRAGQARALNNTSWIHVQLGDHESALAVAAQGLALYRELNDDNGQADCWDSLGYAYSHIGEFTRAKTCYERALAHYRRHGDRFYEADTLAHLGDSHHAAGELEAAQAAWQEALSILDSLQHPFAERIRMKLAGPAWL
ncbi:MAG TPA: tetratricopeptide repeat protein [Candidatus Limnocylindrales bacterium]|nr:tetratricopeptide repeat protein [Candidatus Limnocylindrales bacterium]